MHFLKKFKKGFVYLTKHVFSTPEPQVTIFRKLEDQKFPDGAVISIECELSRHNVDVKWMKASVGFLFLLHNHQHLSFYKTPEPKQSMIKYHKHIANTVSGVWR